MKDVLSGKTEFDSSDSCDGERKKDKKKSKKDTKKGKEDSSDDEETPKDDKTPKPKPKKKDSGSAQCSFNRRHRKRVGLMAMLERELLH